jgi:hypothetical protein
MKEYFEFLIKDYGFVITEERIKPTYYYDVFIAYNSKYVKITIILDSKRDVTINMGRSSQTKTELREIKYFMGTPYVLDFKLGDELFEFSHIIHYLNPKIEKVYIFNGEIKGGTLETSIDNQSKKLSEMMKENCKQILLTGFTPEMEEQIREIKKNV